MKWHGVLAVVWALTACMPPERPQVISSCNPEVLGAYVGASRAAVSGLGFAVPMRWIMPDGIVSLDYNPDRVNFRLDGAGTITRVYCG